MIKKLLMGFCLMGSVKAQQNIITLSTELNQDKSYFIYAESKAFVTYTVRLHFSVLTGYSSSVSDGSFIQVQRGRSAIARLTPSTTMSNSFNYRYTYYLGKALHKQPDSNFVYLLPSTAGKNLFVHCVTSLSEGLKLKNEEHLYSTGFRFNLNDTICATRAGTVFDVIDTATSGEKILQRFSQHRNKIRIEQKDMTIALYDILAPIKPLVSVGDDVVPGQPIAVFNRESDKYDLLFSVEYLDEKKLVESSNSGDNTMHLYPTLPVKWFLDTDKTDYLRQPQFVQVKQSPKIIGAELSKKEKKKLGLE